MTVDSAVSEREKERYLAALRQETATTLRVLRAFPPGHADLRPHAKCKTAKELSWAFTLEAKACAMALTGTLKMPPELPPVPATIEASIAECERASAALADLVENMSPDDLAGSVPFMVGPGEMGEMPKMSLLWFMLHDHIHHRGQFSIYLRMADGRVPSIYGPTADEPWG